MKRLRYAIFFEWIDPDTGRVREEAICAFADRQLAMGAVDMLNTASRDHRHKLSIVLFDTGARKTERQYWQELRRTRL